jgi:CRP-like cAMP-binding protein
MNVEQAQHWLQRLPLFSEVGPESLQPLAAAARLQALPKGAFALRAGDACGAFFVNLGPPVKLFVLAANGNEKVVELVAAGQSFAEALMFLGRPSPVQRRPWATPSCWCCRARPCSKRWRPTSAWRCACWPA